MDYIKETILDEKRRLECGEETPKISTIIKVEGGDTTVEEGEFVFSVTIAEVNGKLDAFVRCVGKGNYFTFKFIEEIVQQHIQAILKEY